MEEARSHAIVGKNSVFEYFITVFRIITCRQVEIKIWFFKMMMIPSTVWALVEYHQM